MMWKIVMIAGGCAIGFACGLHLWKSGWMRRVGWSIGLSAIWIAILTALKFAWCGN